MSINDYNKKKIGFLIAAVLLAGTLFAQEKKSYFSIGGNVGSSAFDYEFNNGVDGKRKTGLGGGFHLGYSYFFNSHWGIATGVGLSYYQTKSQLRGEVNAGDYFNLGNQTDDDNISGEPRNYELRARLGNWEEKHSSFMVEVPLMAMYQTRFGTGRWGMYTGLGVKLQAPTNSRFKIRNNADRQLNISGYYVFEDNIGIDYGAPGEPPVTQHGFGTVTGPDNNVKWNDKMKLKPGIAGTAELGIMVDVGKGMDLMLGGYIDYGLNDIKEHGSQQLMSAPSQYISGANSQVGKGIRYNGMIDSNATDKVKLISFGVKMALRMKLF